MSLSLKSKTAIVTGGAGGLGKAISKAYLQAEANVVILDINPTLLSQAASELSPLGALHTIAVDLTDEAAATAAFQEAVSKFGGVDILVNNAGIMDIMDPIGDLDFKLWERVIKINLTVPAFTSKLLINHLTSREKGPEGGVIVNIGSASSLKGFSAGAAYTASKHGLLGLTKNTSAYYRNVGIRCNMLLPGAMMGTNIAAAFQGGMNMKGYELVQKGMAAGAPFCDLDKIANSCVFLSHPSSSVVNGALISADEGWLAT